jgi:methyl-accepting chemotaxis protein
MRMTFGNKLGLGFGSVLLLMVLSGVVVYLALDRMNDSVQRMTQESLPALRANDDLLIALNRSVAAMRGYVLLQSDAAQATQLETDLSDAQRAADDAVARMQQVYSAVPEWENRTAFQTIRDRLKEFHAAQREVMTAGGKAGEAMASVALMEKKTVPMGREIRNGAETLRDEAINRLTSERHKLDAARNTARVTLLAVTVAAVALGFTVAMVLTRRIVSSVQSLLSGVQTVARGDLAGDPLKATSNDEIGDLSRGFDQMVVALRSLLSEARITSNEVATASSEIATGAQQQLASLNETASSLNQITTTAEEFKATMQEFADRAKAVHEAADETSRRAMEGRTLTQDSARRIEQLRTNARASGESVLHLAEEMQRIGEITASVNEIAEQTKMLALNASIEAARAGEEGRGFAVVAMQVRELANQSKEAAGRIEQLVAQTQKSMQAVVGRIEDGGKLSEDSSEVVRRAADAFGEITRAIEQTREAMSQINTGARQQEAGITQLVTSIMQIDGASKESVAAAEQTQRSIVAIDQRIRGLSESISRFKT